MRSTIVLLVIVIGVCLVIVAAVDQKDGKLHQQELSQLRTERLELLRTNYQLRQDCKQFDLWHMRGEPKIEPN